MRLIGSLMMLFFFTVAGFSAANLDELSPAKRMTLAAGWLDSGKAFQANNKTAKAKNSFTYVIEVYPMGNDADLARSILKSSFGTDLPYDADKTFKSFTARAQAQANLRYRLNNYLMAIEIKEDKTVLHKTAQVYLKLKDKANAAVYLKRAMTAGLTKDEVDPNLKGLQ
jgi:hypothetical protein